MNICQTLQDILEEKKFRVRTANSGNQAIDLSKENNFDIVILDVMMPILNGFETYKKIKEINPNITAIMITGYEQEASTLIQAALDESVLACLSKPLEHNKIFSLIKKVSQGKIIGKKLPKPLMKKVFRMIAETIMIVDDDNNLCETLSDIFSYKGINSITAHTGKEAINKSKEFSPSVVLIDIKLPDMEGTQLFQELKKGNPELICIYISGYASLEHTLTAFKNEAEGFFVKPLPLEELLARTEELLEKKRLKEALRKSEEKFRHLSENLEIQVEERTRDLLQTQGKLIRQERLGIFGQIAGGIAHEFNNILSTIIGATDILLEDVKNKDSI
ncbi:MAG: response regulator, partial [Candidatus Heimdallarchaeota archaeon]|nr:response regulator [Candidatus Heimdallarchaeota archaeon]MCK5143481.1 response regulator [Candidatus Heimdallarchaeota archaeon]